MIKILRHIWWDSLIYEYGNPEILEDVLEIKRSRQKSDVVVMAGNELAMNLTLTEGKEP